MSPYSSQPSGSHGEDMPLVAMMVESGRKTGQKFSARPGQGESAPLVGPKKAASVVVPKRLQ